ncbi:MULTISPECIES: alpha/beta hydrolase [Pseudomonas]|jgi:pimeloyl-ACP methyl ester carboxylesterase|uniref:Lysophospholipase n=1 Tax=Pseudomonas citronellolis TaxID=53408 RepID=A0A1A9KAV8_9PSED|nr:MULTISPECIES: alpha/beta hydrolase [Pseudomonas]KSW22442.1 lysophospholipase [Pseudomonas sp. ADP]ANI14685.1 lysophospholipase [Pseudomonas citronellolis]KRV78273.1 lysophospholipase [Pseudomonas citronellolis]KRW79859.1 lysophospholipase [Pseudomonas citronellolis]MCP1646214.1 pimeloyl-ACP methyl ester carboxylesterase [Pseudomonas citronellolis]
MCKQDYVFRGLGVTLSGRGRIPEAESPDRHPLIIAIHGGTYSSRYFDVAGYSLLDRAQAQQLPIFAIDRPGYGLSADYAANAPSIMDNAEILDSAIHGLWHSYSHKACGIVLVGHSIGGAITIAIAARQPSWPLLGIAISGVGLDPVPASKDKWNQVPAEQALVSVPPEAMDGFFFGPPGTYEQGVMPQASYGASAPAPRSELIDIGMHWPKQVGRLAAQVKVPVHYRQPEFEQLWPVDEATIQRFADAFVNCPEMDAALFRDAGHCIDFHRSGEAFQLQQLAFARRCAARA